jgi:DNA modification methylase
MAENKLILGDNLEILRSLPSESVDLVYIDPPFFSNRNYEVIWGDDGEVRSFKDRWSGGMDHYIGWLKERVEEMYRVLKPTGSMYLHCDWHADAYIRVQILDKIFGMGNFRGDIVWKRHNAHNDAKHKVAVLTDTIWFYTKSKDWIFNGFTGKLDEKYKNDFYKHKDLKGTYRLSDLAKPDNKGYRYTYKGYEPPANGWRCPIETMTKYDNDALLHFPKLKTGRIAFKRYLDEEKGQSLGNIWTDINNVQGTSKERIGYPTQKPEALLERIIKASSNEGDVVLDAFVGGGTTVAVADRLKRKWIGIDQSVQAIKVSEARLYKQQDLFSKPFEVKLHKYDYDTIRYKEAFEFEQWIIEQFGGEFNPKQRGDLGLDGKKNGVPIQVKRSDGVGRNVVDNFKSAIGRFFGKEIEKRKGDKVTDGYIIAFSFGKGAVEEVARLKNEEGLQLELVKVEDIIPIAKKPKLELDFKDLGLDPKNNRLIEFSTKSDANAEFFQWSFNYKESEGFKADVIIDKTGVQTHKFTAGEHIIACKIIDTEGLETLETMKLKVNGGVRRG